MERNYINLGANILMLIMGQGCNMNCKYCLKHTMINEQLSAEISDDVRDYLRFLGEKSPSFVTINYFGGEPLLYYEGIKEVIEHCEKVNKATGNNTFGHAMISNGKALTKEMVDFFNEKGVMFTLSYDGRNSAYTRGYDTIKEKKELLLSLDYLGLSAVITSKAYPLEVCEDFQKIDDEYFYKHGYHVRVNFDDLMDTGEGIEFKNLLDLDMNRYREENHKLFDIYEKHIREGGEGDYVAIQYCESIINSIRYHVNNGSNTLSRCSQGLDVINMDLEGYMYDCHNVTSGKIGHITDNPMSIIKKTMALEYPILHRLNTICKDCDAIAVCGGGCKHVDEDKLSYSCNVSKIKYEVFSERLIKLSEEM